MESARCPPCIAHVTTLHPPSSPYCVRLMSTFVSTSCWLLPSLLVMVFSLAVVTLATGHFLLVMVFLLAVVTLAAGCCPCCCWSSHWPSSLSSPSPPLVFLLAIVAVITLTTTGLLTGCHCCNHPRHWLLSPSLVVIITLTSGSLVLTWCCNIGSWLHGPPVTNMPLHSVV